MLKNPFLIVLIVIMACCIFDSSVINLTYSEQQVFSHRKSLNKNIKLWCRRTIFRQNLRPFWTLEIWSHVMILMAKDKKFNVAVTQ
jgi:hypothetical protein